MGKINFMQILAFNIEVQMQSPNMNLFISFESIKYSKSHTQKLFVKNIFEKESTLLI